MLCSEWVPSEWESDKNITIIHSTPVHQLTTGEDKRLNKSSIKTFLTATYLFRAVLSCKRCLICADFSPDSDQNTFSLQQALLWIMDSYFSQFEVKNFLMDWFHLKMLTDGLVWSIVMFLSAVWTLILTAPIHCRASIAEAPMNCYTFSTQIYWRNKLIYIYVIWIAWGWDYFQQLIIFGWTIAWIWMSIDILVCPTVFSTVFVRICIAVSLYRSFFPPNCWGR